MRVLDEASCFLRTHHLEGRYICGPKQGSICVAPTSVGVIQSFLGLAGYYRRFFEGFSKISKPMTELFEKDKMFEWTSACEASFQELKKRLTTAPI
jgi:hypothetical protein